MAANLSIERDLLVRHGIKSELSLKNAELRIAEMERKINTQAEQIAKLEIKLQEEKVSKNNLELDFEHALMQIS